MTEEIIKATPYIVTEGEEARVKIEATLRSMEVGRLALSDGDQPYVLPMNYLYIPGALIMHGRLGPGKKNDIIRQNPKACFVVDRPMQPVGPGMHSCHVEYESVICYGVVRPIESVEERGRFFTEWNSYYQYDHGSNSMEQVARTSGINIFTITEATMRPGKFLAAGPRPLYICRF